MRRLGRKKTKTKVEGHQDCGVCHPEVKNRKAKTREEAWRFFAGFDDIEPCQHCGRIVLAGFCCKKSLEDR